MGQFVSRDPLDALTRSAYAYAADDPLNQTDPSGQEAVLPGIAGSADAICGGTWEIPGLDVITCGGAAIATAAVGAVAVNNALSDDPSDADDAASCAPSTLPNFDDPSQPPGPGWEWKGNGPPGSSEGAWFNPDTGESLHPDLEHEGSIDPHYDYRVRGNGTKYRVYPDGRVAPKKG